MAGRQIGSRDCSTLLYLITCYYWCSPIPLPGQLFSTSSLASLERLEDSLLMYSSPMFYFPALPLPVTTIWASTNCSLSVLPRRMLVNSGLVDESRNSGNIFGILRVIKMEKTLCSTCFCTHPEIKSFLVTFDPFKNATCYLTNDNNGNRKP